VAKTTGLTFIVPVRDLDAASRFYCETFGVSEVFRNENIAFVGFPGTDTAVGLLKDEAEAGSGPRFVGFHLDHSLNLDDVAEEISRAGGKVVERGEHAPGVPFAHITDPDGNELWV
jgi:predicted enzyme related to lactoylglutathione lyase